MKLVVLSDFTTTQLQAAEEHRQAVYAAQVAQHAADVERIQATNLDLLNAPASAWRAGRYGTAVVLFVRRLLTSPLRVPSAPVAPVWTRAMNVLATGQSGERAVQSALSDLLDDDWTAITGYKNPRGEVDLILVGPTGIMALEVKAINGKVFCDADSWWRDKYDRYRNLVETRLPIADQKGRSPSRQLNEPIDMLLAQLSRRAINAPICRAVVLAHRLSEIGRIANPTVQFVGLTSDLCRHMLADFMRRPRHGQIFVPRVVEVICADHHFHDKRWSATSKARARTVSPSRLRGRHEENLIVSANTLSSSSVSASNALGSGSSIDAGA